MQKLARNMNIMIAAKNSILRSCSQATVRGLTKLEAAANQFEYDRTLEDVASLSDAYRTAMRTQQDHDYSQPVKAALRELYQAYALEIQIKKRKSNMTKKR